MTLSSNVIHVLTVCISHLQDQNEQATGGTAVPVARQHCLEAAAIASLPAAALGLQGPLWLLCHGSILPGYGHHPSIVCKEHQGSRGLFLLICLMRFLIIFCFETMNEQSSWEHNLSTGAKWDCNLPVSAGRRPWWQSLCGDFIHPYFLMRTNQSHTVGSINLVYRVWESQAFVLAKDWENTR